MDIMFLLICAMFLGVILLLGFALHPSSETTSISQRLEGLKASQQQQRTVSSLRDQAADNVPGVARLLQAWAEDAE